MRNRIALVSRLLKHGLDPLGILVLLGLRKSLLGCETVLDIGCGTAMTMRHLGVAKPTGIDGYEPSVLKARQAGTQDEVKHGNVCELDEIFQPRQFDGCVAMDLIEHLPKEAGLKLLRDMESVASKRVVLFTPSGFKPQGNKAAGDLEEHLSGWEPGEMRQLGYKVIGALGPKWLRGELHVLKYRPKIFWGPVALLLHLLWTRWRPEDAAAILCVKRISRD